MPVICDSNETKMVCESTLSGAIREALATSSGHNSSSNSMLNGTDELNIQDRLIACAKRLLINKIEYEEAPSSSTTLYDNLKSKYTVLKPGISVQRTPQNGTHVAERPTATNGHSGTQGEMGNFTRNCRVIWFVGVYVFVRPTDVQYHKNIHNLENEVECLFSKDFRGSFSASVAKLPENSRLSQKSSESREIFIINIVLIRMYVYYSGYSRI